MARYVKRTSETWGLPPGTPVFVGEKRTEAVRITVLNYDADHLEEKKPAAGEDCFAFKDTPRVSWINVDGIHQIGVLEELCNCFGIHPLVLEDILNTNQRPKVEDFGDYIYAVLKMLSHHDQTNEIEAEQVSLILGASFVLSFQERPGDVFDNLRERIRTAKGHIRETGADYLIYALIDAVVDNYFLVLEKLGEDVESLEEELVSNPTRDTLQQIHHLKRDMIFLRRSVWPLRELISGLQRTESALITEPTQVYLRDVYDHTIQVIDSIESFRDMVSGMLDIYLSSLSNRMNEVMKVLTIIATIFIPITFITGLYGMNFEHMPELAWRWAYPTVLLAMASVGVSMLIYFRRKRWL